MYAFISLEGKQDIFNQLFGELKYALKDLKAREVGEIFYEASCKSIKITYESKKLSISNLARLSQRTIGLGKVTIRRYQTNGIKSSTKSDLQKVGDFTSKINTKLKDAYQNFLSLSREEQVECIASYILITAIYLTCCGGLDVEGGLPDMDISVAGIGHHRNIFSHSILLGLSVEFSGRLMVITLEKLKGRLPLKHHMVWDKVYSFIERNQNKAIAAMWLGIGTHLIKDSGIITGGIKPYTDMPLHMSQEVHKITFAINGLTAGAFSDI